MNKAILITRPNHDTETNYLCAWSQQIVTLAKDKGLIVYDLLGKKATREKFKSYFSNHHPSFVFLNGHGNATLVAGAENEPLLNQKDNIETSVVYARSCEAAIKLGFQLVKHAVKTFIGYKRKFLFGYSADKITKPLNDPIARLFLEPSNLIASTLIKNHSAQEANNRSKQAMYRNFRKMISSNATYEERYAARWLWSNINSQVILGILNSKI